MRLLAVPIYEFYCSNCHTQYSFFSSAVEPERQARCPKDRVTVLERRPSSFAMRVGRTHAGEADDELAILDGLDETAVSGALEVLADEIEGAAAAEDPRRIGEALSRFGELTGLRLGDRMQEALARLEAGEDLEAIESDLDAGVEDDEDLSEFFEFSRRRRGRRPRVDPELYFFDD